MLNKLILKTGITFRNKKIFNSLRFLKKTDYWGINELEEYQLEKLIELINWAYNNSKFYKEWFDSVKVAPKDIQSLSDLKKLPIIKKQDLLVNKDDIQINKGFNKFFYSETSGSTGQPLVFYRNAEWDARHRAAIFRGYSWYNVKPWERNGYFWGYNISSREQKKTKFLDYLMNRFRIFSYEKKYLDTFANKLKKADYIEGYSSMIYEIAKHINRNKSMQPYKLKMIKGTAEKVYDSYQQEVEKAFGNRMINEYGAAEAGIIGFECPYGNMHIAMENVVVEEEDGEIVVTNLMSKSFPIIRYKLGDYIRLNKEKKCKCGREHYIIDDVLGRTGKLIKGFSENYPSLTFYYIFKNLALSNNFILNYQIHQYEKGRLIVYIEQSLTDVQMQKLKNEFNKYFGQDMIPQIKDNHEIVRTNGKLKDFISYL